MSTATLPIEKKKTLVPQLRFPEFESEWKKILLDDFAKRGSGHTPNKSYPKYYNGDINWISLADSKKLDNGYIDSTNTKITQLGLDNSSAVLHPPGTVLLSRDAGVGKSAVMKHSMAVSQHFIVWITKEKISHNWFLYNLLQILKPEFERIAIGNTIKTIGLPYFKKLTIIVPSFTEQQKIASFLSAVDQKTQQLSRKKKLLEQYKKGVMQQLFSGKLRFKAENGEDYPDWEEVNGNALFESISNKNHNSDLPILAITQDQGAIPRDLIDYKVSVTDKSIDSYKVVEIGDFIISLRSFQGGIEYSNYRGICSPAYIILRPTSAKVNKSFYKTYLKTSSYIKELQKNLEGIRDGKMISYKYFSDIRLPFPSFEEQQKIADFLSNIDTKIESTNQQITQMQNFKKGLLQQMFV
jgi:type I restriction enzyme S subunit